MVRCRAARKPAPRRRHLNQSVVQQFDDDVWSNVILDMNTIAIAYASATHWRTPNIALKADRAYVALVNVAVF